VLNGKWGLTPRRVDKLVEVRPKLVGKVDDTQWNRWGQIQNCCALPE